MASRYSYSVVVPVSRALPGRLGRAFAFGLVPTRIAENQTASCVARQ
jgi:hypothetical protein